jgi:signal transduction histidine kinase
MVIADARMLKTNGMKLCQKIRAQAGKAATYILLLMEKNQLSDTQLFEAGADDYLLNPFKSEELNSRIKIGEQIICLEPGHQTPHEPLILKNKALDHDWENLTVPRAWLIQSAKMASIGQLVPGLAHEINNPVGFISANLDALRDYIKQIHTLFIQYEHLSKTLETAEQLPQSIKEQVQTIADHKKEIEIDYIMEDIPALLTDCRDGTRRIGKIVSDLRAVAHPENDRQMWVDINRELETTLNVLSNELKYKTSVTREFGAVPLVQGFPQKLNQVFMNILINAAQAIEVTGEITLQTKTKNHDAVVSISDTGCGIEKKQLSNIFDPFFSNKKEGTGPGLGLHIAHTIIKEHKGTLTVTSRVGQGTTVTITLPGK